MTRVKFQSGEPSRRQTIRGAQARASGGEIVVITAVFGSFGYALFIKTLYPDRCNLT